MNHNILNILINKPEQETSSMWLVVIIIVIASVIVLTALVYGGKVLYNKYYNTQESDLDKDDLNTSASKINDSKNRLIPNENKV